MARKLEGEAERIKQTFARLVPREEEEGLSTVKVSRMQIYCSFSPIFLQFELLTDVLPSMAEVTYLSDKAPF